MTKENSNMHPRPFRLLPLIAAAVITSTTGTAFAESRTVVGQQDWLFFRYEQLHPENLSSSRQSAGLVKKIARLLAENGTQVVMSLTPLKMQLYPGYLPTDFAMIPEMATHHNDIGNDWIRSGLPTVMQLPAFQAAIAKKPDDLLFFRLDSHWTPNGARLAAEQIAMTIKQNPELQGTLDQIPATEFTLKALPAKPKNRPDLLAGLPAGSRPPAPETITAFDVQRKGVARIDDDAVPAITLFGSSFTEKGSFFPDAMRHALQRDILDFAVTGRKGPWVGLIEYLENAAYRLNPPKLLIWEFAERDLPNTPQSSSREARYQRNLKDWVVQAASLIQTRCIPSPTPAKFAGGRLPDGPARITATQLEPGKTEQDSVLEIRFDTPPSPLDYLEMDYSGTDIWELEWRAIGDKGQSVTWTSAVPDEGQTIKLRTAMPSTLGEIQSVQILPGKGRQMSVKSLHVCRHPDTLLQGL